MKILTKAVFYLAALLILAGNSSSVFAAIAGHVQFVHGKVQLTTATGVTHAIKKGDVVNEGDTLVSMQGASAQIKLQDGGFIAIRPDTRLKFDRFTFNGQQDGTERSFFSLFNGGFRAITGLIGKKNKKNYQITTPASTIGIRGTDHETFVITPDSSLAASTPVGTYNKVNLGETSMTTEKGEISILPNQMGFAGASDQLPQLQPVNLHIFSIASPPEMHAGSDRHKEEDRGGKEVRESSKADKNEIRESSKMHKNEMRETSTVDKIEVHETSRREKEGIERATTSHSLSKDDAVKNFLPETSKEGASTESH